MAITTGYHRLFSHRTYEANPIVKYFLLFWGTVALQGSAIDWSSDHRVHHRHVDTEKDPYNIKKGFWYAHILWLFNYNKTEEANTDDLKNDPIVAFQHKYYTYLSTGSNILISLIIMAITRDILGTVIFTFLLRAFLSHHTTFFINSLAHMWGSKPYSKEHSAVNNFIISFLTFGEGYHNYHHTFAGDYRNGVRWYQWDPTKNTIWILSKIGLTKNLKISSSYAAKVKLVNEDRKIMLEKIKQRGLAIFESDIKEKSQNLIKSLNLLRKKRKEYKALEKTAKIEKIYLKKEIKTQKTCVKNATKQWFRLCDRILS